jgi:predicted TIM-barrel fold metal-dependent hydrolase
VDPSSWGDVFERHLETTRAADVAIVFGIQAAATGWHVPNDLVAAHVTRASERLVFFASIDPGQPGFEAELERCHQDLRCQGVKLAPIYQGVHPLDLRYRHIYGYCQQHGLPILIHMATTFSSGAAQYRYDRRTWTVAVDYRTSAWCSLTSGILGR